MAMNGGVDLLLKVLGDVQAMKEAVTRLEGRADKMDAGFRGLAAQVETLRTHTQALSEQVHEFRTGVGEVNASMEKAGDSLRAMLEHVRAIEQEHSKRLTALEAKVF